MNASYPNTRLRRNRKSTFIRNLLQEVKLHPHDFIMPLFVLPGEDSTQEISSMPGVFRYTTDRILKEVKELSMCGIQAIALFPVISLEQKSEDAKEAYNPNGLIQNTIRAIKDLNPSMGVISDVALDPYTKSGQDGIIDASGYILNDLTNEILVKQSLSHAVAGADIVAPSDMMDGRIGAIRRSLESNGHINTKILSYAAKYASNFYGPFRDAVDSKNSLQGSSKESYQMDFSNSRESILEVSLDISEGADIVMVKPGLPYLDIIRTIKEKFEVPIFSYQVSGEYSMIEFASRQKVLDKKEAMYETLTALKRAGSSAILTYFAKEAAQDLT